MFVTLGTAPDHRVCQGLACGLGRVVPEQEAIDRWVVQTYTEGIANQAHQVDLCPAHSELFINKVEGAEIVVISPLYDEHGYSRRLELVGQDPYDESYDLELEAERERQAELDLFLQGRL